MRFVIDEDELVIDEDEFFVDEESSVSDKDVFVIDEDEFVIDEDEFVIDQDGSVIDQDRFVIDQDGSVIDEDGSVIDEDGFVIGQEKSVARLHPFFGNVILVNMTETDDLDQVVTLAGEVAALRQRLVQLDAERVTIERQIADYVNRIAASAVAVGTPQPGATPMTAQANEWKDPMTLSAAILYVFRQSPEKLFTAPEIAGIVEMTDSLGAIRTHLSRLAKKGVVTRLRFGKYKAG